MTALYDSSLRYRGFITDFAGIRLRAEPAGEQQHHPMAGSNIDEQASKDFSYVLQLSNRTHNVILKRFGDSNVFPYVHTTLVSADFLMYFGGMRRGPRRRDGAVFLTTTHAWGLVVCIWPLPNTASRSDGPKAVPPGSMPLRAVPRPP